MKIVVAKVGQEPEVKEINGELHEMQEIVGGYIQAVYLGIENIFCVCNEEGKFKGLAPNFMFNGDIIVGDVFFCTAGEEDFKSLNDHQVELMMNMLHIFGVESIKINNKNIEN